MPFNIRSYSHHDRSSVRNISCDVANRGDVIDKFFPDREVTADLLTIYYTDYEPSSSFVAISEGRVVGYLNGCLDNRCYGLVMVFLILPKVLLKALFRGVFWDKNVLITIKMALKNWKRMFDWRKKSFNSHDGHCHIGILSTYRQHGIGHQLVEAFEQQARQQGIESIGASVHSANEPARRFFDSLGFKVKSSYPMIGISQGKEEQYQALLYVKDLS